MGTPQLYLLFAGSVGVCMTGLPFIQLGKFMINDIFGSALGSSTATYTVREFASRLLVALIDGHWPRLKLLNEVPGRGTLFVDVLKALHNLGFAPALRVNRDPPGTLTAEQEAFMVRFAACCDDVWEDEASRVAPDERRAHHLLLLGQGGSGKTHVVQNVVFPAVADIWPETVPGEAAQSICPSRERTNSTKA